MSGIVALVADGPEANKAGPLGLLTILVLGLAVYFLWRSMNKHLKKVPESFDDPPSRPAAPPAPGSPTSGPPAPGSPAPGSPAPGSPAPGSPTQPNSPAEPPAT